jgi:GrpB-like predicted nucleotidyltransferase (UPF0157 family)
MSAVAVAGLTTLVRMEDVPSNPAALADHDLSWALRAGRHITDLRAALGGVEGDSNAKFDHIGSTSVPGLAAKPYIDLQVRILPLPSHAELASRLEPLGYRQEHGARPDSPGVTRDSPRGHEVVDDEVWEKRLYVLPPQRVILHFRRADSPWGWYTVWFRDWLRENPEALARYEATKRKLSKANEGKPDVDDYTRAKTSFFDEVQDEFTRWAGTRS